MGNLYKSFMKIFPQLKTNHLIIFLMLCLPFISRSQQITIEPNQPNGTKYCKDPVFVAPNFTMSSSVSVTGMKISISQGYLYGEDELRLSGSAGSVNASWSAGNGYLTLTGSSSINDYILAIRKVQYLNISQTPSSSIRYLTFSLEDADFLPETQHFYRFINKPGISWTNAKAEASSPDMKYYGLQGYLATISSSGENDFIQQKTNGVGWIGASDAAVEGEWRWVTGPEGTEDGGKGRLFWRGSGGQAKANPTNFGPVINSSGVPQYHNWNRWDTSNPTNNPMHYEPNDNSNVNIDHQEDYAHITFFPTNPSESKKWNDYPNTGSNTAGYLIEYGGMPGELGVSLTSSLQLFVGTIAFAPISTDRSFKVCEGIPVKLNVADDKAVYSWSPATGLSNPLISNPVAKPSVTTEYTLTATNQYCNDTAKFKVNVLPAPISALKKIEDICVGKTATLDPGLHASYLWANGSHSQTITTGADGYYAVTLTGSNGCKLTDSSKVVVHPYPKMDLSKLNTMFCGPTFTVKLNLSTDIGSYVLTNQSTNEKINGTTITVPTYGDYKFTAMVTDLYNCPSKDTTINVYIHKIPKVDLTINETICYGYNLQASYVGTSNIPVSRFTWIFGGDTISNKLGQSTEDIPLGVNQTKRDLVLNVTEDGCTGTNKLSDILVIPDIKLFVKNKLQCQPIPFEFSATNTETVVKYEWDWGDGTPIGLGKTATHPYAKEGYYDVRLTVTTDKGCTNSATIEKMVYVAPIPTVSFSLDPGMCLNPGKDTLKYTGSANNNDKYYWDLKGFDPVEIVQSPDTTAGPFVFDLIKKPKTNLSLYVISQYGCKSPTGSLEVKRRPIFSFSSSAKDGCAPLSVDFKAKADDPVDDLSFKWAFGDGENGDKADMNHIYQLPNLNHGVRLTAYSSITGCSDSTYNPDFIIVHPNPTAGFTMDHDIVYNDASQVVFTDQSVNAVNFLWDFGDTNISKEQNPVYSYLTMGHMKVVQTVYNEFGCQDTTSKGVLVAFSKLFAPNAFAPNAPTAIDREFKLYAEGIRKEGYHLMILSRWNDVVFECKNEVKAWDGKMSNGNYAPAGTYIWVLECSDFLGRAHRQTGSLTLVF